MVDENDKKKAPPPHPRGPVIEGPVKEQTHGPSKVSAEKRGKDVK